MGYSHERVESRWQAFWQSNNTFRTNTTTDLPTYYVLDMFPYPSGSGLHVGHVEGYTASDIMARFKRMQGFEVLHPMGWDAFGLPAEQYAIDQGVHPDKSTGENVGTFRSQLQNLGFSYDWEREVGTSDPEYYKWTQWIFLKLLEHDLAYQSEVPVNWCPALGTVLANDEIIDGKSERGGHPVERRPMKQWMLRITKYADRLLDDLEKIDLPESIKSMQRDRIGRSEGADCTFALDGHNETLEIFTTRPDTLFGATFCVLAPEHELIETLTTPDQKEAVERYRRDAAGKSDLDRTGTDAAKTGVDTGAFAINPANGKRVPIWVADYVLMTYGTGAIMCVPGHDERDWAFARRFDLPIFEVVSGGNVNEAAWSGDGKLTNSAFLDGMEKDDAITAMISWLEEGGIGRRIIRYRMRDWIFARQRYWGEPIPVVHGEDGSLHALPEEELPLLLPEIEDFQPTGTGSSPLERASDWVNTHIPGTDESARREVDTMPGAAGSSWYFLRFIDPDNNETFCCPEAAAKWMPVDLYIGGAEHAVGHLIYSRFWTKFLNDLGVCPVDEPFQRLVNQGMILGEDGRKMSKRYGNVVNPNDVVDKVGADALRIYEMFMGPIEQSKPWNTTSLEGSFRFVKRIWRLYFDENDKLHSHITDDEPSDAVNRLLHKTIDKITHDTESMQFNTAISQMMIFVNEMTKMDSLPRQAMESFAILLGPYAPHLAEELWDALGHEGGISRVPFPSAEDRWLVEDTLTIPVQVNGKIRAKLEVPADISEETIVEMAKADERVAALLDGKQIRKLLYIPGRMVTIAVS